jgi:hypothetical protein
MTRRTGQSPGRVRQGHDRASRTRSRVASGRDADPACRRRRTRRRRGYWGSHLCRRWGSYGRRGTCRRPRQRHVLTECLRLRQNLLAKCGHRAGGSVVRLGILVLGQQLIQGGPLLPTGCSGGCSGRSHRRCHAGGGGRRGSRAGHRGRRDIYRDRWGGGDGANSQGHDMSILQMVNLAVTFCRTPRDVSSKCIINGNCRSFPARPPEV